jgi:hypothetical protein
MDIGKAFTFIFDDDDAIKKLLIGVVVFLIPIVNFAGFGYLVQLIKNVEEGLESPLPEWDNFGGYFIDGLKVLIGLLVYSIPMLLVGCALAVSSIAIQEGVNPADANTMMGIVSVCLSCFILIFALLPYIFMPAIFVRFAETGELSSVFRIGELWSFIQQDIGSYAIVLLLSFVVFSFLAPLGVIACFIGAFVTQWWAYLIFGHLTGQLAKNNAAMAV